MDNTINLIHGRVHFPIFRVGLDLDLTAMNNDIVWSSHFATQPCLAEKPHRPTAIGEASQTYDHFKLICRPCFMECIENPAIVGAHAPFDGLRETLKMLYEARVEIHVITARTEVNQAATMDWLGRHGLLPYIASVTFSGKKLPVCEALQLDYMIDDSPAVFDELRDSGCEVIMRDTIYNSDVPVRLRMPNWRFIKAFFAQEIFRLSAVQ